MIHVGYLLEPGALARAVLEWLTEKEGRDD
jgi:hypothetical protein